MSNEVIDELRDDVDRLHQGVHALLKTQTHILSTESAILRELVYIGARLRAEHDDARKWRHLVAAAVCGIAAWAWFR